MDIKPGLAADIVVNVDFEKELVDVRRAVVYDVIDKRIILSETSPPIARRHVGNRVAVTYSVKEKDNPVRYGFYGEIVELIRDYELASAETVVAVVVEQESDPVETNIRMFYRAEPRGDSGVALFIAGEKVNIIDISIGGAKVTHPGVHPFEHGRRVEGVLHLDGEAYDIEARILRVWQTREHHRITDMEFVTMQFLNIDSDLEDLLARKIREVEREIRFREMFP